MVRVPRRVDGGRGRPLAAACAVARTTALTLGVLVAFTAGVATDRGAAAAEASPAASRAPATRLIATSLGDTRPRLVVAAALAAAAVIIALAVVVCLARRTSRRDRRLPVSRRSRAAEPHRSADWSTWDHPTWDQNPPADAWHHAELVHPHNHPDWNQPTPAPDTWHHAELVHPHNHPDWNETAATPDPWPHAGAGKGQGGRNRGRDGRRRGARREREWARQARRQQVGRRSPPVGAGLRIPPQGRRGGTGAAPGGSPGQARRWVVDARPPRLALPAASDDLAGWEPAEPEDRFWS
jgi:hypothetical protein